MFRRLDESVDALWLMVCSSADGFLSVASLTFELLRGLEKLKDGRGRSPDMEYSDNAEGERETGSISGLKGERSFLEAPTSKEPVVLELSSSALSMTDRMLAMLRGDRGWMGDFGGARVFSCLRENEDSLVRVLG